MCQSVQRIVALAHRSDETAEGVDVVLALDGTTVLVDLGDRNLDRGVVLGLDDASGGRLGRISITFRVSIGTLAGTHAFAGDVNCRRY